jgi:hypothetical protein
MKKLTFLLIVAVVCVATACSKSDSNTPEGPRTNVPKEVEGNWMYGNFSMTEYWNQYPGDYIGQGFEIAFAFTFNVDGTYTEYFTSSYVTNGVRTYLQSVSKGMVEINPAIKEIKTHTSHVHYRKTVGRQVEEDRDLNRNEYKPDSKYTYTTGVEPSGTDALYLTLDGDDNPLTFLRK